MSLFLSLHSYVILICSVLLICVHCLGVGMAAEQAVGKHVSDEPTWYSEQRLLYYGIPVQLRFRGGDAALAAKIWSYLESIDTHFNDYKPDSEISKINAANKIQAGKWTVSEEMQQAILLAQQVNVLSDGAFDISLGPLRRVWKQAVTENTLPTIEVLEAAQALTGMRHVYLDGETLQLLKTGISLDMGGIIKGIAVDNAMNMLKNAGIKDAMVQVGGETACMGVSPRNKAHVFAVPDPREPSSSIQIIQDPGTGYSGCTSGNYRQPLVIEGKQYYHIFDPRTAQPTDYHVLSVSVVFPRTGQNGLADGLATAGVVMGPEKLIPLVHSLGGACLIYVMGDDAVMKVYTSERWADYVCTE